MIGFSSWLILPIRANANVVVNENNPSNARELLAYYNLEQYPRTYLFYGPLSIFVTHNDWLIKLSTEAVTPSKPI